MTINELKEMKRFPKDLTQVEVKDQAKLVIKKFSMKSSKTKRNIINYIGVVSFVYENGKEYSYTYAKKTLKETIKVSIEGFEQRNNQMLNYRKRGLNLNVSS
jgi:hypothetical protein